MLNNPNSDQLHLVQGNEFLPSSSWMDNNRVFLVGTFSAAVALANYSVTVKAPANIRPLGELRIVQAASEGVVKSIEVKENQVVRKGDAI